jgi:ceramide glucosyltransferase
MGDWTDPMDSTLSAAYVALALAALVQSALLALQTWEHRRYSRVRLRDPCRAQPAGRARVVAPCKGVDLDLERNLRRLFEQDYPDYELVLVVESAADPACRTIRRLIDQCPAVRAELVVAGRAVACGQKVHNLLAATADLPPEVEYLVFVDSDAQPRRCWLRRLVAGLAPPQVGAVTGYRWFLPERPSLPNCLAYAINCGVEGLLIRRSHYFVWGGSWAIRRERFEALGIRRAWEGTLSDDLVASRQLRRARLPTHFDPACVVGSPLDVTWRGMFAFLRRQYLVARFYTPGWWAIGLASSTLTALAWLGTFGALAAAATVGRPPWWAPAALGSLLYAVAAYRAWLRQDLAARHFPDQANRLRRPRRVDIWLGPVVSLVNWAALVASAFGRQIAWRGNRYRMHAGGRCAPVEPPAAQTQEDPPTASVASCPASRSIARMTAGMFSSSLTLMASAPCGAAAAPPRGRATPRSRGPRGCRRRQA